MSKKKPCSRMGCGVLVPIRQSYCKKHKVIGWHDRTPEQQAEHSDSYGHAWRKARSAALARDHYVCQVCRAAGRIRSASAVDHIVPIARGGAHDQSNLQAICGPCHDAKTYSERENATKSGT